MKTTKIITFLALATTTILINPVFAQPTAETPTYQSHASGTNLKTTGDTPKIFKDINIVGSSAYVSGDNDVTITHDSGKTWERHLLDPSIFGDNPTTTPVLVKQFSDKTSLLIVGTFFDGIYTSNDNGTSWQQYQPTAGRAITNLAISDGYVYFGILSADKMTAFLDQAPFDNNHHALGSITNSFLGFASPSLDTMKLIANYLYIIKGGDDARSFYSSPAKTDSLTFTNEAIYFPTPPPSPQSIYLTNKKAYIIYNEDPYQTNKTLTICNKSIGSQDQWSCKAAKFTDSPDTRSSKLMVFGNNIYLATPCDQNGSSSTNKIYLSQDNGNSWIPINISLPNWLDNKFTIYDMFVLNGENIGPNNKIEIYLSVETFGAPDPYDAVTFLIRGTSTTPTDGNSWKWNVVLTGS